MKQTNNRKHNKEQLEDKTTKKNKNETQNKKH